VPKLAGLDVGLRIARRPMWQRYILDPLRGRTPLRRVIWVYGVALTLVLLLIEPLFVGSSLAHGIYYGFTGLVGILQSIMLWQCAYNAKSRAYGVWIRLLVILGLLMVVFALCVLWRHPEIKQLLDEAGTGL
jgi:hypothetical protein